MSKDKIKKEEQSIKKEKQEDNRTIWKENQEGEEAENKKTETSETSEDQESKDKKAEASEPQESENNDQKKKKIHVLALVRQFAGYAWQCHPQYFIFYILDIIVYAAAPFVNIIFPARIIDELVGQRRIEYIILYTAFTVGINTLCNCLKNLLDLGKDKYGDTFGRYVSLRIAEKCVDMDFQHTEDKKVLEQLEKAKTGMEWYSGGITGILNAFSGILINLITALGVIVLLLTGMPWLVVVYVISVALDILLTKKTNEVNLKSFQNLSKVNQIFSYVFWELQDIRFGKDIRLYGAEPMMEKKSKYYNDQMTEEWHRQAVKCLPYEEGSNVLSAVRSSIAILMIGAKALKGLISLGDFTMYFSAGNTLYNSMKGITWQIQDLYQKLCYANEFVIFMEYPNAVHHGEKLPQRKKEHTIEFQNVSFAYPGSKISVLKNINVVLHPGEHISIVGLNGAGKTTFIKLLCRLYDPTEGKILLDGVDIREIVYEEYVKLLAVVFQDFQLFAFTARENITLTESYAKAEDMRKNEEKMAEDYQKENLDFLKEEKKTSSKNHSLKTWPISVMWSSSGEGLNSEGRLIEENRPYSNAHFDQVLEQTGLTETIANLKYGADTYIMKSFDNEGCEMSGGQQQKLAIARALYKNSPIVILDEPTAALDPIAEYEIYRQFHTLVGGKTAIYISHRLSSCQFCDIIYVFVDGEIRERGTHEELAGLKDGYYAKMFEAQAQYYR